MGLQARLDAYKAEFEKQAPAEVLAVMRRVTADLVAGGQAERALKAGDTAPAFALPDPDGVAVSSADLLSKGPVVLTFYRGVWCPYCNLDLAALEAARPDIEARGARLVAVSPQTPANSRKAQRTGKLGFPILSDAGGAVAAAFGLRWTLPEDLKLLYTGFGVDLATFNGDDSWTLPMPARYVIGRDGIIAYAEVNPDYTRRPEPEELFPALERLRRAAAA
jgi:peroxiredoxin